MFITRNANWKCLFRCSLLLLACRIKKKRKRMLVLSRSKVRSACLSSIENVQKYENFTGNYFTCGKEQAV